MDLSPDELRELAIFFARRMSGDLRPLDPTEPPIPGDPVRLWEESLQQAQDEGRLGTLASRIARVDPGDAALQEACALLQASRGDGFVLAGVLVGGAGLAAAALLGLAVAWSGAGGFDEAPAPSSEILITHQIVAEPPAPAISLETKVEATIPLRAEADPAIPPMAEGEPEASPAVSTRCAPEQGDLIGYWYAGSSPPGEVGEILRLSHAVHVRADYPHRDNAFDTRAEVTCVLQGGDRVRLSVAPIHVPKDAWWIPLRQGDLLAAEAIDGPLARR